MLRRKPANIRTYVQIGTYHYAVNANSNVMESDHLKHKFGSPMYYKQLWQQSLSINNLFKIRAQVPRIFEKRILTWLRWFGWCWISHERLYMQSSDLMLIFCALGYNILSLQAFKYAAVFSGPISNFRLLKLAQKMDKVKLWINLSIQHWGIPRLNPYHITHAYWLYSTI